MTGTVVLLDADTVAGWRRATPSLQQLHAAVADLRRQHPSVTVAVVADPSIKWALPEAEQDAFEKDIVTRAVVCAPAGTRDGTHGWLVAVAERMGAPAADGAGGEGDAGDPLPLDVRVHPTLLPRQHPLAGVHGVNNAIPVEGDPVGRVMFYGPGAGAGPTASAVVADILNIAGIRQVGGGDPAAGLDPLLAANSWRRCRLVEGERTRHRNYVRLRTRDEPGVIGRIGNCFGHAGVSIQSIVQFETREDGAEIVVITHEVLEARFREALAAIEALADVEAVAACLRTL